MQLVYLSLGSNLGDRAANVRACIAKLREAGRVTQVSSFYETEPMEIREQPWFLNCAVEIETDLTPQQLLARIQSIEAALGRTRAVDKGPRTIDVDILLYGGAQIADDNLQIPHPAIHRRRFVLEPLAEIAVHARNPASGKTVGEMLGGLGSEPGTVRRLATK